MVKTSRRACPDQQLRSPRQDSVTYWAARRVTSRDVALCHVILPHKFKPKTPCRLSDGLTVTSPESYSVARVIARGRSELTAHRCLDTGTWVNTQLVVECRYLIAPIHWRVPTGLEFARSRGTRVPDKQRGSSDRKGRELLLGLAGSRQRSPTWWSVERKSGERKVRWVSGSSRHYLSDHLGTAGDLLCWSWR